MMHAERPTERPAGSFYPWIRQARLWLPSAIVGVVLVWQLVVVRLGGDSWRFWSTLLFYSILGPAVTYLVLNWIARQVQLREEAQARLSSLYSELQESHELLGGIQQVTEEFATSSDLESTLAAAARGLTDVAGAVAAHVTVDLAGVRISDDRGFEPAVREAARSNVDAPPDGMRLTKQTVAGQDWWVLSEKVGRKDRLSGTVQAWFRQEADERQREAFNIIAAEYGAAAEAAGSRMRDLATLVEVDRSMRAEGNLSRLLELLLDSMMQRTAAAASGILLADEGDLLHLTAVRGPDPSGQHPPIRPGAGVIGSVAELQQPLVVNDLDLQPETRAESPLLEGARSLLVLPLQSEGMFLGLIMLAHGAPGHFQASGIPLLELMAGQVSGGVRNARAYLHSEELAIAEERARIAR
ncbi:MAG TPA: GAF domain-containing protein, partial [Deinococcales bacterium]|nr:GAF domain-containing protein [Deinococcales bacterium]